MVKLSLQDYKDVLRIANLTAEIDTVDDLRKEALHLFQKNLKIEKGNFFLILGAKPLSDLYGVVSLCIEEKNQQLYRHYYHRLDPFFKGQNTSTSPVITTDDLLVTNNFVRTEYYNDFLKPQSIHHQMTLYLNKGDYQLGVITLFRPRKSALFSSRDKAKASLILPSLIASLERTVNFEKLLKYTKSIDAMIFDLPYTGLIILNQALYPIYFNQNAKNIFLGLKLTNKSRADDIKNIPRILLDQCRRLIDKKRTQSSQLKFSIASADKFHTVKVLIRRIDWLNDFCILIALAPEEQILNQTQSLYQRGITPRELDVLSLVANGLKNKQIAEKLFISHYTVENHLKSIYRKMDCQNRIGIIHKLMQLKIPNI